MVCNLVKILNLNMSVTYQMQCSEDILCENTTHCLGRIDLHWENKDKGDVEILSVKLRLHITKSADKILSCCKVKCNIVLKGGMMAPQRSPATNLLLPGAFNPGSRTPTPVGFQQGPRTPTANLMSPPGNISSSTKVWIFLNSAACIYAMVDSEHRDIVEEVSYCFKTTRRNLSVEVKQ